MELGALDVDRGHLGIRYDNAAGILAVVKLAAHGEAGFGGGGRDQLDDHAIADEWCSAPVLADEGNRRCSILFHLLVPGGRWLTTMSRPNLLASFCNSRFHSRTREPLLPPPSAVISNRLALG